MANQYVIVICLECNEVYDLKFWYVHDPSSPVEESHGYCQACGERMMASIS